MLERWPVPEGGAPRAGAELRRGDGLRRLACIPTRTTISRWLEREDEFLREVLAEEVPAIGVCLGAQMLARAAGASVGPAREPEIGWHEVDAHRRRGSADPVLGVAPAAREVFQWHHYTFALPAGGDALAESAVCLQAFRLGGRRGESSSMPRSRDAMIASLDRGGSATICR